MDVLEEELEHAISRLEAILQSSRSRPALARELRRHLRFLHIVLTRSGRSKFLDPGMHRALHQLMRRAETAKSTAELQDVARDIRQYQLSISSLSRARELEHRLEELEGQVKTTAEEAASSDGAIDTNVVTLESLKGKRILFAIMPFSREYDDVWTGGIKRAATGTGLTPIRIDMITQSSEITDDIVRVIRASEIVVVDVTGNNPNVMFEFGFALASKKRHAVISQSTDFLTFDIKNLRTIIYKNSWQGVEALHKDLQAFIKGAIGTKKSTKKKVSAKRKAPAAKI